MEHLRQGRSLVDYKRTLEGVRNGFGQRRESLLSAPRLQRLDKHLDRLNSEIEHLGAARQNDVFPFPDGIAFDTTYNYMQVLVHLPTSRDRAIPSSELAVLNYAEELEDGEIDLAAARTRTLASVHALKKRIGVFGWDIENASPDFVEDNEGKKRKAEARYFLTKTGESKKPEEKVQDESEIDPDQVPFRDEVFILSEPTAEAYTAHAQERVALYLQTGTERILREHQIDVFESLFNTFASGKRAGTIVLPTGGGKTHVAGELIRVLGLPAIVFSTTKDILAQNGKTISGLCKAMEVTDFFGDGKNLKGHVINTLYQSFPSLLTAMGGDLSRFGLVIYDEADLSLGEERHKIHEHFPNAIKIALTATPYYDQIENYKERGVIKGDEEWLETFTNPIHTMSLEEAFERGVIPHLDIHLVRTNSVVPNVGRGVDGDYSPAQVAKYLNTISRNALIVAMIAGLDSLPPGFTIPDSKRKEIEQIHAKIAGRRTVIQGINVNHLLVLEKALGEVGISAKAIYGKMKEDRADVIEGVKEGRVQVILGDQLTGRGLDIPELEVGLYAAPTISSRELVQEVGRLFRHSRETGKEKGIAIQLVDVHQTQRSRQPVLIPSIFHPDFVLRGSVTKGPQIKRPSRTGSARPVESSGITIEGSIDLDAFFEEVRLQDLLQQRFKEASLGEINEIIQDLHEKAYLQQAGGELSLFDLYSQVAQDLPTRNSFEVNQKAIEAIAGGDEDQAKTGRQVLIALNLKTILGVVTPFLTDDTDRNNELVQHVMEQVSQAADRIHDRHAITVQINRYTILSARRFVSAETGFPIEWIRKGISGDIARQVELLDRANPLGLTPERVSQSSYEISDRFDIPFSTVAAFFSARNAKRFHNNPGRLPEDFTSAEALRGQTGFLLTAAIDSLQTPQQKTVMIRRFLEDKTLDEIGEELGLSRERIRQIESKSLTLLRHPSRSRRLRGLSERW